MSDTFLPDIDIRIGALRPHNPHSIHSFGRQVNRKKNKKIKYELIKQSLLTPIATPLHKLVRVSLSNKTVVFKKKMLAEQKTDSENRPPLSYHKTNKIVIMNQSPQMKEQASRQRHSVLKGCKSLLNPKLRDRRLSFEMFRKGSLSRPQITEEDDNHTFDVGACKDRRYTDGNIKLQDFDLCPWQHENRYCNSKHQKTDECLLEPIRRCL